MTLATMIAPVAAAGYAPNAGLSTHDAATIPAAPPRCTAVGAADGHHGLTGREVQVLRLLATGLSNREIAVLLEISAETVKAHVQHMLQKLGVGNRTQAAVWAVRQNLI
jgi:DNA-binding NarL/FixJ family response regulator